MASNELVRAQYCTVRFVKPVVVTVRWATPVLVRSWTDLVPEQANFAAVWTTASPVKPNAGCTHAPLCDSKKSVAIAVPGHTPQSPGHDAQVSDVAQVASPHTAGHAPQSAAHDPQVSVAAHVASPHTLGQAPQSGEHDVQVSVAPHVPSPQVVLAVPEISTASKYTRSPPEFIALRSMICWVAPAASGIDWHEHPWLSRSGTVKTVVPLTWTSA